VKSHAEILAELEPCPRCKGKDYLIARDMKATRHCRCGHTWVPPVKPAPTGPSHLDRLKEVFEYIGVAFTMEPRTDSLRTLRIEGDGYTGFYHVFDFNADGQLVQHGGYE
jgi:hypothetical protein